MHWSLCSTASLVSDRSASPKEPSAPWGQGVPPRGASDTLRTQLVQAQAGDREAFAGLYEQCGPAVHALLRAMLPADQVADVHQEVFLAAWLALPRFQIDGDFTVWVYGIARNQLRRHMRGQRRELRKRQAAAQRVPAKEDRSPLDQLDRNDRAARILTHFQRLAPGDRELLGLRLIQGLSAAEMARLLSSTPGSVRVRVHRALVRLRQLCQEDLA